MLERKRGSAITLILPIVLAFACACTAEAQSISALSVTSGPVGTPVTITGTGFGATQGSSIVTFSGVVAVATTWNDTSINVTVPTDAVTGPVLVTVGGTGSNSVNFTVTPHITALSLTTGPTGMGFVITGTTFGSPQGSSSVMIGSVALTVISWTDSAITVALPPTAVTGEVTITVDSQPSNGMAFSVVPPFGCS